MLAIVIRKQNDSTIEVTIQNQAVWPASVGIIAREREIGIGIGINFITRRVCGYVFLHSMLVVAM